VTILLNNKINWIECDCGPHIIIEKRLSNFWGGIENISHRRTYNFPEVECDYDGACEIEGYVGKIQIEDGEGIVISEDICKSAWVQLDNSVDGGILVVVNYMDDNIDESVIFDKIRGIDENEYTELDITFTNKQDTVCLFAATDKGPNWTYKVHEFKLDIGTYKIDMIENYNFNKCSFRIHRFRKIK
jgi:hypothetical protein